MDERESALRVREMFARITGRYDLLNHLLSFNIDRYWRARTVRRLRPVLERPGARVMDLCCGTGDLTLALGSRAIGSDFCHPMLVEAARKGLTRLVEADALSLPVADGSLDLVTMAFGFRNLTNYDKGLAELRRVLAPGGVAAILEFSKPKNPVLAALYSFYSRRILPAIGGAVSGDPAAYQYLPESVRRFPSPEEVAERMRAAGFAEVTFERLSGGIVVLIRGEA